MGHPPNCDAFLLFAGSGAGPSTGLSPARGSVVVHRARPKAPAGRRLVVSSDDELEGVFVLEGDAPVVGEPKARATLAVRIKYDGGLSSDRPGEAATSGSSPAGPGSGVSMGSDSAHPREHIADSGSTRPREEVAGSRSARPREEVAGSGSARPREEVAGFGSARPQGEIADLSEGAPRLKSRLSSPPPVSLKRGGEADPSGGTEDPLVKMGKAASHSSSEGDDGATLTLLRRRRSARSRLSGRLGQEKIEKSQADGSAP